jgi:hypothetical protein
MVKDSERGGVTSHAGASAGACSVSRMAQGLTRHAGQNGAGSGSAHGISLPDLFIYLPRNLFINTRQGIVAHSQFTHAHNTRTIQRIYAPFDPRFIKTRSVCIYILP